MADDFTCRVSDFGMSRDVSENGEYYRATRKAALPVRWMAIEALEDKKFTEKTDVWWEALHLQRAPLARSLAHLA